jgi:UDP-N-acetylglucosamine 2-epimerase (non-hydrolysing)
VKVVTLVGTRPELIKLSLVIAELDRHTEHVLVHSGQNYDFELNEIFFQELGIRRPDHFLEAAQGSPAATIARVIERFDEVLEASRPDAMVLLGDTNSCLGALAAKRRKIPIFHLEAGNRCFDARVPEEINRKIVDHLSDVNLTYTEHARRYLLSEGLRPETIIKIGSPLREVLARFAPQIAASQVLAAQNLQSREYFLVSAHREENVDAAARLRELCCSIDAVATSYGKPVLFSTHPRTRARLERDGLLESFAAIRFVKPLGYFDYVHLQQHALCVLSDSGTLTEESSMLGFPAVMIREAHERPEGVDEAAVIMSGITRERVLEAVRVTLAQAGAARFHAPADYAADNVSHKVVRIVLSLVDYVNRTTWFKNPPPAP